MFSKLTEWLSSSYLNVKTPITNPQSDRAITEELSLIEKKIATAEKHIHHLTQLRSSKKGSVKASLTIQVNAHQERLNELLKRNNFLLKNHT